MAVLILKCGYLCAVDGCNVGICCTYIKEIKTAESMYGYFHASFIVVVICTVGLRRI